MITQSQQAQPAHPVFPVEVGTSPHPQVFGLRRAAERLARKLGPRRIWHVNSTPAGGGVAELLWSSIARQQSLGLPVGWLIADAEPEFFQLTKRIHHGLHNRCAAEFTAEDARLYRDVTARSAKQLLEYVRPGDVVLLHDPQTAGIAPHLLDAGVKVVWRSHIGTTERGAAVAAAWNFLRPYVEVIPTCVFTIAGFAPAYLSPAQVTAVTPSIDPEAPKNRDLSPQQCRELLRRAGLTGAPDEAVGYAVQDQPLPADAPVVTQVSRWDPLKDMTGVLRSFAEHVPTGHLLLAGPDPADIPDDPEGAGIFAEVCRMRESLPPDVRRRVHLCVLTLADQTTNALVINAIQRSSTIIVQKSLEEGFGLTVTEAMWKSRPIVATSVGGLTAQLVDGSSGLLVDPTDSLAFASSVNSLLADETRAARLGAAAHDRCRDRFLVDRELGDYLNLYRTALDG
ncbi:glycosyltransferase [Lentzea jiangxiensis]|uniref:Trehalose synthase n=1 Tax=Lentzea jiangxiensis TaxID=641025 RepID=A0A1H0SF59_9PSEU|nr:glycosyltransferase [Lentzea jiangxiensis]SDP40327.1 trehalose synthase [Lentzea jiangxiensis]